jgi:hypothetical protein
MGAKIISTIAVIIVAIGINIFVLLSLPLRPNGWSVLNFVAMLVMQLGFSALLIVVLADTIMWLWKEKK